MSSSPDLPSLNEVTAKRQVRPPLRSGSKAAPIPEDAVRSFTSAASFLRAAQAEANDVDDVFAEGTPSPVLKTSGKQAVPKTLIEISPDTSRTDIELSVGPTRRTATPPPSKSLAEEVDDILGGGLPLKTKPWRKYKSPKRAAEGQSTISTTKVTKLATKAAARKEQAETVSRHFSPEEPAREDSSRRPTPERIEPEPAHPRRMDWTPPRADTINLLSDSSVAKSSVSKDVFGNLHDAYGCKEVAKESIPRPKEANVLGKRKQIETVMIRSASNSSKEASREPSPVKSKAPKKKQRTITELATAAYVVREQGEASGSSKDDSLLKYFGSESAAPHQPPSDATAPAPKKRASRAKAKKAAPQIVLLSPESAMRESARQDFVFGTSSQLAREHSPTLLRDLHMAMQASNTVDDPFASSPPASRQTRGKTGSSLWSVGARGADGELLEVEVIDLVQSPVATHPEAILNPWKDLPQAEAESTAPAKETATLDLPSSQNSSGLPLTKSNFFSTQRAPGVAVDCEESAISRPVVAPSAVPTTTIEFADQLPPSNQEVEREQLQPASSSHHEVPRPNFELYTDAQLAGKIASYGFKPVKKRTAMIALLDRCWGSKSQGTSVTATSAALSTSAASSVRRAKSPSSTAKGSPVKPRGRPRKGGTTAALATVPATTAEPAKKPRGRPRKDSAATAKAIVSPKPKIASSARDTTKEPSPITTPKRRKAAPHPVIEIADTDSECGPLSPSPPCSSPADRVFSSPPGVDMSITEGDTELTLNTSPTDQQAALFGYITRAVTSAPPTVDPANPSWHEKMLMYDPVVLEDLAAWLNAGQLTRVGYADEVSPADVKRWCESKSVCCLWRATFKGKERKRF